MKENQDAEIFLPFTCPIFRGWSGVAPHQGVQLILAYSWARPAILVAGKGRERMFYFFCFFSFISIPLSSLALNFISSTLSSISFLPAGPRSLVDKRVDS